MRDISLSSELKGNYPANKEDRIVARRKLFVDNIDKGSAAIKIKKLDTPTKLADVIQQLEIVKKALHKLMLKNT